MYVAYAEGGLIMDERVYIYKISCYVLVIYVNTPAYHQSFIELNLNKTRPSVGGGVGVGILYTHAHWRK